LRERASMLRYMYIVCLVYYSVRGIIYSASDTSYTTHNPVKFYSGYKLMCSDDMRNLITRKCSQGDLVYKDKTFLRTKINLHSTEVYDDDTVLREERVRKCCTEFENGLTLVIAPVGP
jgi:hypothetical protein